MRRLLALALACAGLAGGSVVASTGALAVGAPTVTDVAPGTGYTTGGQQVTVTGTNFTGASAVAFGTVRGSYSVVSDTQINAVAPGQSVGTFDVRVTTPLGTSATSAGDQFTYATPAMTSAVVTDVQGQALGYWQLMQTGVTVALGLALVFLSGLFVLAIRR